MFVNKRTILGTNKNNYRKTMKIEKTRMRSDFNERLEKARTLADIFEVVKAAVWESSGKSRAGLMLGLANLGNNPQGFLGAFYPVGTNVIVMNRVPLDRIKETDAKLYKPYIFHVLLHEYIHTLGYLGEDEVRGIVLEISKNIFGEEHLATMLAKNPTRFIPNLAYQGVAWQADDMNIEIVPGFDRGCTGYIA